MPLKTTIDKKSYGPAIKDADLKYSYAPKPLKIRQPKEENIFTISASKAKQANKKNDYNEPPPLTMKRF